MLVAFVGRAQFNITQNLGSPNTLVKNPNYGGLQGGLIPFTFADTTAANLTNLKYYAGAYIYTTSPRATWWRDAAVSTWVQVLPGGGSGSLSAWTTTLNTTIPTDISLNGYFGTTDANGIGFYTSNTQRLILPATGLTFNQLISDTTANKVMTFNPSTKAWGYGYWYGGGSGATPTWQQTLTAGSTLTGANTIQMGGYDLIFHDAVGNNNITFSANDDTYINIKSPLGGTIAGLNLKNGSTTTAIFESIGDDVGISSVYGHLQFTDQLNTATLNATSGIEIYPYTGLLNIDTLINNTAQNQLIGWTSTAGADRGEVGYITIGSGLSLSGGALSSTGSANLTATYLGYGSGSNTLTGDANLTYTAASSAVALDSGYLSFTGHKNYGSAVNGSIFRSSLYGLTTRAVAGSSYDWLLFSAGGNTILANPTGTDNFLTSGKFGFGSLGLTPSALVNIAAGTATANTAPLKFTSGTNLTTAEAGAVEYNGSNFFMTATATNRRQVALSNVATPTSGYLLVGNGTDWTITAPGSVTGLNYISALANGSGTTASGNSIDLGGSVTANVAIDEDGGNDISFDIGRNTAFADIRLGALNFTLNGGPVQMNNYGAGTATFDASGNITSVSDMRLKNLQGMYGVGLKQLMQINPIVYKYNKKSKLDTVNNYIGFSAQNVKDALGENAVGINKDGYYSLQDRALIAASINAIKELKQLNDAQQKEIDNLKKEVRKLKK